MHAARVSPLSSAAHAHGAPCRLAPDRKIKHASVKYDGLRLTFQLEEPSTPGAPRRLLGACSLACTAASTP
eukprot:1687406-Prymnesium_polylepis.1